MNNFHAIFPLNSTQIELRIAKMYCYCTVYYSSYISLIYDGQ